MLDNSRIKGICFDVDGTLSDTDDEFVRRFNQWLLPFRFLFPAWDSLSFSRRVIMATETPATFIHGIPDRIGFDGRISALGDYLYRRGLGRSSKPFSLIPGVIEMLEQLCKQYPLGIVSARGEKSVLRFLSQFDLGKYFKVIVTSQTCERTKPDPDPVIWFARQVKLSPHNCLMVGDTTVDIIAGKIAGAQAVGVLCGFGEERELMSCGADLIITKTPDLIDHLLMSST